MQSVQSAHYYRGQASLCLEIATQMSDPVAATKLRASAAEFLNVAAELGKGMSTAGGAAVDARIRKPR
jgi:hypothetical protein